MDITLRQLRTIRELASHGTIAAAAASLGYTASAVSQQLTALERVAGVPVVERVGRGVRLTDAGRALVHHADVMLATLEEARAAVEEVGEVVRGDIRMAVFETAGAALMPGVIRALARDHPQLVLRSVDRDPETALAELVAGRLDLALVYDYANSPSARPPGVERLVLLHDRMRLAVPADDDLTGVVDLASLAHRPFVVSGPLDDSCARCLRQACRDAGFEPDMRHQIDAVTVSLQLVAAGAGLALLPDLALAEAPPGVRLLELTKPVHRTVEVAYRSAGARRPAIRAVVDALVAVADRAAAVSTPVPSLAVPRTA